MKIDELKSELNEKEKGCFSNYKWNSNVMKYCSEEFLCPTCQAKIEYLKKGISACEEKDKDIVENILNRIDTCVISPFEGVSLDKDITRGKTMDLMREQFNKTCNQIREEILNSQESLNGNKANTSPTAPKNAEELSEVGCDRKSLSAPDKQEKVSGEQNMFTPEKSPVYTLLDGEVRSSLTIQEVYNKMQYSFYEGLELGKKQALSQRNQEELDILVNNIEQVRSFIKLHIPNVQDKYIIVNCFSGMINRQLELKKQLTTNSEGKA